MNEITQARLTRLKEILKEQGRVAVCYSGGVDSTFLLKVAHDLLGEDCIAVTAMSSTFSARERRRAAAICEAEQIRQIFVDTQELTIPEFYENPPDRCYHCKKMLMGALTRAAAAEGFPVLAEGTNADDLSDYRPGFRALQEMRPRILSPLLEAGLTKAEIREASRKLGLTTADLPSFACLATRFAYGERITAEGLKRVEAAEEVLAQAGFTQFRVRVHQNLARIEVAPGQMDAFAEEAFREDIYSKLKALGYAYVTLDLRGYRTGSMNEVLADAASINNKKL
ncbi:MAG: ATP-dependent sacrificial sulfur transferase LarE [Lachnospiraceae bacterium]|nr:ATP-dependent sacrificial sulfur transferase LarE [Lachnospiraceae bacterium]